MKSRMQLDAMRFKAGAFLGTNRHRLRLGLQAAGAQFGDASRIVEHCPVVFVPANFPAIVVKLWSQRR